MSDERCEVCVFAHVRPLHNPRPGKSGVHLVCRRYPPTADGQPWGGSGLAAFPVVTAHTWCGEFKLREER